MLPENKIAGNGGSFAYSSTTVLTGKKINAIAVFGAPILETLEDEDGDCLAKYGFVDTTTKTLSFGMLITAQGNKPFTKVKFSTAGYVLLYRE